MFFKKKSRDVKCESCGRDTDKKYNFCPYCGKSMLNKFDESINFGMIGKSDMKDEDYLRNNAPGLGMLDRVISSMVGNLAKNLMNEMKGAEIKNTPNSISIRIGAPGKIVKREERKIPRMINEEKIKKMSEMPRTTAKTAVKRIGNKIIYELSIPDIESPEDVFVSKLESGYDIKAVSGNKKVYVNSLPINLPIKSLAINPNALFVEFRNE